MSKSEYRKKYEVSKKSNSWAWIIFLVLAVIIRLGTSFFWNNNENQEYATEDKEYLEALLRKTHHNLELTSWIQKTDANGDSLTIVYSFGRSKQGWRGIYFETPQGWCGVVDTFTYVPLEPLGEYTDMQVPIDIQFYRSPDELGNCEAPSSKVAFYLANNAQDPRLQNINVVKRGMTTYVTLNNYTNVDDNYDFLKEKGVKLDNEFTPAELSAMGKHRNNARTELQSALSFLPSKVNAANVKINSVTNSLILETNKGIAYIGKIALTPQGYFIRTALWLPDNLRDVKPTGRWNNVPYISSDGSKKQGSLNIHYTPGSESMIYLTEG